jgi:hypothetical protein
VINYQLLKDQRLFLYGNYRNIIYFAISFEQVVEFVKNFQSTSTPIIHLEISDIVVPLNLLDTDLFLTVVNSCNPCLTIYFRQCLVTLPFVATQYLRSYFFLNQFLFLKITELYTRNLYGYIKKINSI